MSSTTVISLINGAYYTSGVVSREFQTVEGSQLNDGLNFLNDILGDKAVELDMVPYNSTYPFVAEIGTSTYFIPNLIDISTLVFFINDVRYSMVQVQRDQFFGTPRADNIQSLPFSYHMERCVGGANIYLYFSPNQNFAMELHGLFRLAEVSINQDLSANIASVDLGQVVATGAVTLAPGQFLVNDIDLAGVYAAIPGVFTTAQLLTNAINANVPGVVASLVTNGLTLASNVNLFIRTSGIGDSLNTITFQYFSTLMGPKRQTYLPFSLDRFYVSYLKYALAVRICNEFNYPIPPGVALQFDKYETMISSRSQQLDLTSTVVSSFESRGAISYAQINLGGNWLAV